MTMNFFLYILLIPLLVLAEDLSIQQSLKEPIMMRFQTGVDVGSTFAGGMTYDPEHHRLFVTGATYARGFFQPEIAYTHQHLRSYNKTSDCFLITMPLEADPYHAHAGQKVTAAQRLGMFRDTEACGPIHYIDDHQRVFLAGSTTGDHYGPTDVEGDAIPTYSHLLGQILSTSIQPVDFGQPPILPQHYMYGGTGFFGAMVDYPISIVSDFHHDTSADKAPTQQSLYVASMTSPYVGEWKKHPNGEYDLTYPIVEGNVWGVSIQKLHVRPSNATDTATVLKEDLHLERDWMFQITTTNYAGIRVADLIFHKGRLFLVGSTTDTTDKFGPRAYGQGDWDGFIVELDPESGNILPDSKRLRFSTQVGSNEHLQGTCMFGDFLYIVGETQGIADSDGREGGGIIYKINLNTMELVWNIQIHGRHVSAWDCATTLSGDGVYVAGDIYGEGSLAQWAPTGGDDIFVGLFEAGSGNQIFLNQMGSVVDDSVAKNGAIVVDKFDNAIILGNTRGGVGRERVGEDILQRKDDTNDIFVLTVKRDGTYLQPDPVPYYQVPRQYFAKSGGMDWAFLVYMALCVAGLLTMLLLIYAIWKPIDWLIGLEQDDDDAVDEEFEALKSGPDEPSSHYNPTLPADMSFANDGSVSEYGEYGNEDYAHKDEECDPSSMMPPSAMDLEGFLNEPESSLSGDEPIDVTNGYYEPPLFPGLSHSEEEKTEIEEP